MINYLHNVIELARKRAHVGKRLKVHGRLYLHGHGDITIGNNCIITSSSRYNPTDGSMQTHFSTKERGKLLIGDNVGISNTAITAANSVTIEDDVLIGSGCVITDTDHHELVHRERGTGRTKTAPIIIKKGAFIGMRSIILKGTTIGENSVIGAGSVVAKDIPSQEVWAGNPAVFIRKNS